MNGYIEEVCSQGTLMDKVIAYYSSDGLMEIKRIVKYYHDNNMNRIILSGMGSSLYAIDSIKSYLTSNGIQTLSYSSFELSRYQFKQIDDRTLVVVISQSGNSQEVIELVEKLKDTKVVGIYNNESSKLSELCCFKLPIKAEKEVSVTSKTYEFTMLILNLLASELLNHDTNAMLDDLKDIAKWIKDWTDNYKDNSQRYYEFAKDTLLFDLLANDSSLATAKQMSLAYREGLHNCTAVWECADYAHGQYHSSKIGSRYLAQMFFPLFEDNTKEMKMLNYIIGHGGKVILYTTSDIKERDDLLVLKLPQYKNNLMPLIESVAAETILGRIYGPTWVKDH